jgi:16S rRNA U516 pseudouridylate synthase RsuA-like enzyme
MTLKMLRTPGQRKSADTNHCTWIYAAGKASLRAEEINAAPDVLLFYKPAGIVVTPKRPQKRGPHITLIVHTHNLFDGIRSLFRVVKGNSRRVVMQDVRLDRAVEYIPSDKT